MNPDSGLKNAGESLNLFKAYRLFNIMQKEASATAENKTGGLFEEEIKKPYYSISYLDSFKLPYERLEVSAIIPTYNRCPYKPESLKGDKNPLAWAISSLLLQKPTISEIIVIDDFSSDKTEQVVSSFMEDASKKGIKLIYKRNKKHLGYSASINFGSSLANSKYLFLVDDDSIVAPYAAFGAVFTYEWLKKSGINIGIINLPPYSRSSIPNKVIPGADIGKLDFARGIFISSKNAFPEEYLSQSPDKFIHQEYHILKPIQIEVSGGYILCSKEVFTKVGGFPLTVFERFMDVEFGLRALENGYSIYLSPDPKFHCVHGSYGLKTGREFEGEDWFRSAGGMISLKNSMRECDKPSQNSGCRIDTMGVLYNSILSFFCMAYKRNSEGAIKWMKKVYEEFVKNGNTKILNITINYSIPEKEREILWNKAIKKGIVFVENSEKIKLKKIKGIKDKIEAQRGSNIGILDMLSSLD